MTKLETLITNYRAKKEELTAQMKAELAPLWSEIVAEQAKVKKANDIAKAKKAAAYAKDQLAKAKAKIAELEG